MRIAHTRKRNGLLTVILLIAALLAGGCSDTDTDEAEADRNGEGRTMVTMTPVELFEGDSKKFEPFLGAMSRSYKLRYEGDKPNAHLELAVWKNGKRDPLGSVGDLFFSADGEGSREIEVLISEPTASTGNDESPMMTVKAGVFHDSGSGVTTFTIPEDMRKTRGLLALPNQASTFPAEGTVYLWGMHATSSNAIRTSELSPESVEKLEWALVAAVRFED